MNDSFHLSMQILIIFFQLYHLFNNNFITRIQYLPLCIDSNSVVVTIFALLQHFSQNLSQHLVDFLWSLWKHKNLKLWKDVSETCAQVIN